MDQKSLIEVHGTLSKSGWEIKIEMTGKSRTDTVKQYFLSHPKFAKESLSVTLSYPIKNQTDKYELITRKESKIISSKTYSTESEAQYGLADACEKLIEEIQPDVT